MQNLRPKKDWFSWLRFCLFKVSNVCRPQNNKFCDLAPALLRRVQLVPLKFEKVDTHTQQRLIDKMKALEIRRGIPLEWNSEVYRAGSKTIFGWCKFIVFELKRSQFPKLISYFNIFSTKMLCEIQGPLIASRSDNSNLPFIVRPVLLHTHR